MADLDIDIIKQEILSLLVSAKNGLTEHELSKDYRMYNSNKDIPFRSLGYGSLLALLGAWPDVCRVQRQGNQGPARILAVEEENTKHILSMVKGQKQSKTRSRGRGGGGGGGGYFRGGRGGNTVNRSNFATRFSENSLNVHVNWSRGSSRTVTNDRSSQDNNRFQRPTPPGRPAVQHSNQNYRNPSNNSGPPQFARPTPPPPQQQQNKPKTNDSMPASTPVYESKPMAQDRSIASNAASFKITVPNHVKPARNGKSDQPHQDYSHRAGPVPRSISKEFEHGNNEQDEPVDREEQAVQNLRELLGKYPYGIQLLALDGVYQKQYHNSLLGELKLTNVLLIQEYVDDFAAISRHYGDDGSCNHIITLKDPEQVAQIQMKLLKQITTSGVVPATYRYANNLLSYISDQRFQGIVSDIDKHDHCFHIQPIRYQQHIETLMEELDSYYSSSISNALIIPNISAGVPCVTKYNGVYHRVFIQESDLYKCFVIYVDYGTAVEMDKNQQEFKCLLQHFAELPRMAIACRLDDVSFLPDDGRWSPDAYHEVCTLCKDGPFFIEPTGELNGLVTIRICDVDNRSLNDIVVELKLAVKMSDPPVSLAVVEQSQPQFNEPKPVALSFDFSDDAVQCPLPDSDPSTPDENTYDSNFKLPEQISLQPTGHSSNAKQLYKRVDLDRHTSFHLIRHHNNKWYLACLDLARLLHVSQPDILLSSSLTYIPLTRTAAYSNVIDSVQKANGVQTYQDRLFISDLKSVVTYIETLDRAKFASLIALLHEEIQTENEPERANNADNPSLRPQAAAAAPNSHQTDTERCNELLARRNILCNLLRSNNLTASSIELELVETQLQQLVEKMHLGAASEQSNPVTLTPPPGFNASGQQNPTSSAMTEKLKGLMNRCKTLIRTIVTLHDYVPIDDAVARYVEHSLPCLTMNKNSKDETQLYAEYSDLLRNLTDIVDHLRQQLPAGVNV